jgi:hypothetical protein
MRKKSLPLSNNSQSSPNNNWLVCSLLCEASARTGETGTIQTKKGILIF